MSISIKKAMEAGFSESQAKNLDKLDNKKGIEESVFEMAKKLKQEQELGSKTNTSTAAGNNSIKDSIAKALGYFTASNNTKAVEDSTTAKDMTTNTDNTQELSKNQKAEKAQKETNEIETVVEKYVPQITGEKIDTLTPQKAEGEIAQRLQTEGERAVRYYREHGSLDGFNVDYELVKAGYHVSIGFEDVYDDKSNDTATLVKNESGEYKIKITEKSDGFAIVIAYDNPKTALHDNYVIKAIDRGKTGKEKQDSEKEVTDLNKE